MPQSLAYNNAVLANTITASGTNVGVNTASPSFQLHVVGSGYVSSGLTLGISNLNNDTTRNTINGGNLYLWSNFR